MRSRYVANPTFYGGTPLKIRFKPCYRSKRSGDYPSIAEQLDALYHAVIADPGLAKKLQGFVEPIRRVKEKHPK